MEEVSARVRVVVIDDDAMVLKALDNALTDLGYDVNSFEDPRKGLDWINENGCDIVIADICMPHCDGFEVLRRVKRIDPGCDLIFITAHAQIDTAVRALREGATDFFEKPLTVSTLHAAMVRTTRYRELHRKSEILTDKLNILQGSNTAHSDSHPVMLGRSEAMKRVADAIVDVAGSSATVLVTGESGTGKELVAAAIHSLSERKSKPFLILNCPSVPEELFESELFGHRRGAFTGAVETRAGYVEAAEGGTLFLDEIGDLPLRAQSKILRLLEQKAYAPIGEHAYRNADVRIVAATNQPLLERVRNKTFREDLYYRLNVCRIEVPPLRDRREDVPLLALYFTLLFASEMKKDIEGINDEALGALSHYSFPGNIRELRNMMESAVIRCRHNGLLTRQDTAIPEDDPSTPAAGTDKAMAWPTESIRLTDVEKQLYIEALKRSAQNVSAAARLVGLSRSKLRRRMEALGIAP